MAARESVMMSKGTGKPGEKAQAVVRIWFRDVELIKFKTIVITNTTSVFAMRSDLIRKSMKGLTEDEKEKCMDKLLNFQVYVQHPNKSEELITDESLWKYIVSKQPDQHFIFKPLHPDDVAQIQRMKSAPPKFGHNAGAMEMDCSGPVFSMPLDVIMLDQGKGFIPFVVQKAIDFLDQNLQTEGLFIQSGNVGQVQELVDAFDRGEAVKVSQYTGEPNVVADLLLTFFRRLPDPPFAYELYNDLIKATTIANKKAQVHHLRFVCDRLSDISHNLLESLFLYLNRYCNASKSKIGTLICLSAIFGPILIRKNSEKAAMGSTQNMKELTKLTEIMIEQVEELFGFFKFNPETKFEDIYEVKAVLGKGAFAVAKEVIHKMTGQSYAVKMISKSKLSIEDQKRLKIETNILKCVRHPNIIALKAVCETEKELFLVMELAKGGELFDHIVAQGGAYAEEKAQRIVKQLFQAIDYLHDLNIVHRDIKPENILLKSKDSLDVKIADFGLAKMFDEKVMLQTACGSPEYVAPEILMEEKYGKPVDIWSIGVIAYIVLSGYPPFYNPNMGLLFKQILTADYTFEMDCWQTVSQKAMDFVSKLLVVDPAKRLTSKQALSHPWLLEKSQSFINVHEKAHLKRDLKLINSLKQRSADQAAQVNSEREKFMESHGK